jgi:hypothetical protein
MARLFVYNDNLTARVELVQRDDGSVAAYCAGCTPAYDPFGPIDDMLTDSRERFALADARQFAAAHVDQCRRCVDAGCRTWGKHDAGHHCRK